METPEEFDDNIKKLRTNENGEDEDDDQTRAKVEGRTGISILLASQQRTFPSFIVGAGLPYPKQASSVQMTAVILTPS